MPVVRFEGDIKLNKIRFVIEQRVKCGDRYSTHNGSIFENVEHSMLTQDLHSVICGKLTLQVTVFSGIAETNADL